jgi:hypothetical protein
MWRKLGGGMVESNSMQLLTAPIAFKASPVPDWLTLRILEPGVGVEPTYASTPLQRYPD